jgi:hypothetical protein
MAEAANGEDAAGAAVAAAPDIMSQAAQLQAAEAIRLQVMGRACEPAVPSSNPAICATRKPASRGCLPPQVPSALLQSMLLHHAPETRLQRRAA